MPLIKVELLAGRSHEQRSAFVQAVTDAAVIHLGAAVENVRIRFVDLQPHDVARGGKLGGNAQR